MEVADIGEDDWVVFDESRDVGRKLHRVFDHEHTPHDVVPKISCCLSEGARRKRKWQYVRTIGYARQPLNTRTRRKLELLDALQDGWRLLIVAVASVQALKVVASDPGESTAQARPMPPTNVRVDFAPTAEVVNKIFQGYGIAKETRALIGNALKQLDDSDLNYLAKALDPATIGFVAPDSVSAEDWARIVPAYAEAMLVDRKRRSDVLYQLGIGIVLAVLGIPLAVWGGMWLERRRSKPTPAPAMIPPAQQSSAPAQKRKSKRRRR